MLRLSSRDDLCNEMGSCTGKSGKDWREHALKVARERAENGDSDAMTMLYTANQGLDWLEKAANAGNGVAQKMLAGVYQDAAGGFLYRVAVKKQQNVGLELLPKAAMRLECIFTPISYMKKMQAKKKSGAG